MRKRTTILLAFSLLLLAGTGCHLHEHRHPHGMPPGQTKKIHHPVKVKVTPARPGRRR